MSSFPETLIDPRLRSHGTGRIFDRLKNLTGNFVHMGTVQFFSLCSHGTNKPGRILTLSAVLPPAHAQSVTIANSKWRAPSLVTTHPCNRAFAAQKIKPVMACTPRQSNLSAKVLTLRQFNFDRTG